MQDIFTNESKSGDEPIANPSPAPKHWEAGLAVMNADKTLQGRASALQILERFEAGQSIPDQATALGITPEAIYRHLMRHSPEVWGEYQGAKALARLEMADTEMEGARDGVSVSRARERARLAMWTLERTSRKLYGIEPAGITINLPGSPAETAQAIRDLEARLGLAQGRHTLEGSAQVIEE